jgi:putative addiction module component (TIGR02574 family)
MKTALERTALELLGLPASARAMLAEKLLASLEDDEPSEKIENAWKSQALTRYRASRAGKTKPRPHEEVMRDARRLVPE